MSLPKAGVVVVHAVYHVYLEREEMASFLDQPDNASQLGYLEISEDDLISLEIRQIDYE